MKRYPILFLLLFALAAPVSAQTCPPFPARGVQIIDALYNPTLAMGTDDQRRSLTRTFIEQLVFESPSDGWVWKSADPGRPPSKDSIARMVGARLCNWDWQNGESRRRSVQAGQIGDDITGQNPIPIPGVNHLTDTPVPVPTPTPVPAPTLDLSGLYSRIDWSDANNERRYQDLKAEAAAAAARDAALAAKVQAVYDKPGLVEEILKSPYLYTIVGSILAGHYALPSK